MSLMWPGKIEQAAYEQYLDAWHRTRTTTCAWTAPTTSRGSAYSMLLAIAPTEDEARDIAQRGHGGPGSPHPQQPTASTT